MFIKTIDINTFDPASIITTLVPLFSTGVLLDTRFQGIGGYRSTFLYSIDFLTGDIKLITASVPAAGVTHVFGFRVTSNDSLDIVEDTVAFKYVDGIFTPGGV